MLFNICPFCFVEQGHSTKELQKEKADGPVTQKSSTGPSSTQHQVSPSKPKT